MTSQKLVFLAVWKARQRKVVVKRIIGPGFDKILAREGLTHPLSMRHPNIIETHSLRNLDGETLLVEPYLANVLHDDWEPKDIQDGANLVYHMADALQYLHRELGYVHGDVKPDNIGRLEERFVLLDFGICRRTSDFSPDTTATGSLRTRAPELLVADSYRFPEKADVWALGATVYRAYAGRFPLVDAGEDVPRISAPTARRAFEETLRRRAEEEWDSRADLTAVPGVFHPVLQHSLEKDPMQRFDAAQLLELAENTLGAYVTRVGEAEGPSPSPPEVIEQLEVAFRDPRRVLLMAEGTRGNLLERLQGYKRLNGFDAPMKDRIKGLIKLISPDEPDEHGDT